MSCLKVTKQDGKNQNQNRNAGSKTDSKIFNYNDCNCDELAREYSRTKASSQKLTYSAQHQAPYSEYQPAFFKSNSAMANTPSNIKPTGYPNGVPLYNVSSGRTSRKHHHHRENAIPVNNMHYSCPCNNMPPPLPPPTDDLWDLQFCRWWGWNWIRKREEMLNQKRAETKVKSNASTTSVDKKRKRKMKRKPRKQNDVFTWWNKLFRKSHRKSQLENEEKKQLQNLYDTPCSSITFNDNNCPCPIKDWECRSIKLEGDYYCSSTGRSSVSKILVRNKTRRQASKQHKRKHQSWVFEKTDSSSSEEYCPCVSLHPVKEEGSVDESVEYLSLRMAHIKDSEDNIQFCPCMKLKELKKDSSKPNYKAQKKNINYGCPCRIRLMREKHAKTQNQKPTTKEQPVLKQQQSTSPTSPLRVVPRFRKPSPDRHVPPVMPDARRRSKRKYIPECFCQGNKEYILYCPCQLYPRKKVKKSMHQKKIYHCCCCCCSKNNKEHLGHQSESTENSKAVNLKSVEEDFKQNVDQNGDCVCIGNNNADNIKINEDHTNNIEFSNILPKNIYCQESYMYSTQPHVSKALDKGFYVSPLTGKTYTLHPGIFPVNDTLKQFTLPKPLDLNEKIFNTNFLQSPLADEEHTSLLNAVCEAILSSRNSNTKPKQSYSFPSIRSDMPLNNLWSNVKVAPLTKHRQPKHFGARNIYRNRELYLNKQYSDEIQIHNYESDYTDNSYQSKGDTKYARYRNLISSKFEPFTISKASDDNDEITEVSKTKHSGFINYANNTGINIPNISSTSEVQQLSPATVTSKDAEHKDVLPGSESNNKTRIPIRMKTPKLLKQVRLSGTISEQKLLNNQDLSAKPEDFVDYIKLTSASHESNNENNIADKRNLKVMQKSPLQNQKSENNLLNVSFNSPRNWTTTPKNPGISLTGLLSSVTDPKDAKSYCVSENKYKFNMEQFKKHKLYDVFFASDKPDFCEDFPNIPISFRPNTSAAPSYRINHLPHCPLVLQELSAAGVTRDTQTQGVDASTSISVSKTESEKELRCLNLTNKNKSPVETGINTRISCVRDILEYPDKPKVHDVNQGSSYTKESQSEKEICCTNVNEAKPDNMLHVNDTGTLATTEVKDSECGTENTCLFLQHTQPTFRFLQNPVVPKNDNCERVMSVISRISEESLSGILNQTDEQSHDSLTETSSFLSFLRDENRENIADSTLASALVPDIPSSFNVKVSQTPSQKPVTNTATSPENRIVETTTSPFKIKYSTTRRDDKSQMDYYSKRKVAKRESPFSMFCVPVLSKNVEPKPGSDTDSISRPERKMVLSKQLKEREKRWKY